MLRHSGAPLLQHSTAQALWRSAAPVPYCLGALLLRRSGDQLLWHSNATALRRYAAPGLWRSAAPAPSAPALCCSRPRASPGQMIREKQSAVINLLNACRCSPANDPRGKRNQDNAPENATTGRGRWSKGDSAGFGVVNWRLRRIWRCLGNVHLTFSGSGAQTTTTDGGLALPT